MNRRGSHIVWRGLGATNPYADLITSTAPTYGLPPSLALAVATHESSLNPNAVSSAGAQGLFQLMPATAASLGVTNSFDPVQNVNGGLLYLSQLYRQYGDWNQTLIAYNEGPGNLARRGVFPSSAAYASSILADAGDLGPPAGSDSWIPADSSDSGGGWLPEDLGVVTGLSPVVFAGLAVALIVVVAVVNR